MLYNTGDIKELFLLKPLYLFMSLHTEPQSGSLTWSKTDHFLILQPELLPCHIKESPGHEAREGNL